MGLARLKHLCYFRTTAGEFEVERSKADIQMLHKTVLSTFLGRELPH